MSNVIRCDDVDINKINYLKPEKNGQSYFAPINYGDTLSPLYIQTPKLICKTNISDVKDKKIPYLDLEIPTGKLNIYDFLLSLDDQNIKTTVKKSNEWFGKEIPLEAIDDMYKRTTKPFKKNTCPTLRLRLPVIKNKIHCGVYNQKRVFIGLDEIKEGSEMVLIIHIRGLKILKTTYYCDCYISQIKVFQDTESKYNIIPEYSIIDEDNEEDEDIMDLFKEEIEQAEKEQAEKEQAEKEQAEKEKAEKEQAEKERLEKIKKIEEEIQRKKNEMDELLKNQ
tara:strand:+ start:83 stop:922 length:840 start_codon:yes stop_codon:yes gene_type:complete